MKSGWGSTGITPDWTDRRIKNAVVASNDQVLFELHTWHDHDLWLQQTIQIIKKNGSIKRPKQQLQNRKNWRILPPDLMRNKRGKGEMVEPNGKQTIVDKENLYFFILTWLKKHTLQINYLSAVMTLNSCSGRLFKTSRITLLSGTEQILKKLS